MVNFGKFSSENTVIFDDFSPKMTTVRPKYVAWGSIQDGVAMTRIRYLNEISIFWPRTMVNFGKCSSENTVIFNGFSPKMTKVRPKYVSWVCNQDGVAITRIQ